MLSQTFILLIYMALGTIAALALGSVLIQRKIIKPSARQNLLLIGAFGGLVISMAVTQLRASSGTPLDALSSPQQFQQQLSQTQKPVVIKFHAKWCGACKVFAPTVKKARDNWQDKFNFYSVDVDLAPSIAQKFEVKALPTLVVLDGDKVLSKTVGVQNYSQLEKVLTDSLPR